MRCLAALACLAACAQDYTPCTQLVYGDFHALDCAHYPVLCDAPVERDIVEHDVARAYDLAFLPEGFTAEEMPAFRERVRELVEGLRSDEDGIVALAPKSFNFYRIDIASRTSDIHDADRVDTMFAGCLRDDELGGDQPFLATDEALVELAARANVPEADVAIVIVNETWGRANAGRSIRIGRNDSARVLTHELGHALFNLADEYADTGACFQAAPVHAFTSGTDDLLEQANVSRDPRGAKWANLVLGAETGGKRHAECIYHPTNSCRMLNHDHPEFCPVCRAEIRVAIAAHTREENDGPPALVVALDEPTARGVHYTIKCRDRNPPVELVAAFDHELDFWAKSQGSVAQFGGTHQLAPGAHSVYVECRDAGGLVARTTLPFVMP